MGAATDSDIEIFLEEDSMTSTRPRLGRICHRNVKSPQELVRLMSGIITIGVPQAMTYLDKNLVQIHCSNCNA